MTIYSRERIQLILHGQRADRFAVSCWRHFFETEHDREKNLEALVWFQKEFGWDFVKLNSPADYHVEGWGVRVHYSRSEHEKHQKSDFPVRTIADWTRLKELPLNTPALADELWKITKMRQQLGPDIPILMTIFTPLAIAARLVPEESLLLTHLQQEPEAVAQGLETITRTFARFVVETRNAGADGIFFATSRWGTRTKFSWEEYQNRLLPFDRRVLGALDSSAINMLHLCDRETFLTEFANAGLPAKLINWNSVDPTNLPIDKGAEQLPGMVMVGGIDHDGWLLQSAPDEVHWLTSQLTKRLDPSRVILAAGCTLDPRVPMHNLAAMKAAIG